MYRNGRKAPGPKGLPFVGSALDAKQDPLRFFSKLSKDYGDLVGLFLGPQYIIFVNRPDLIEKVLITEAKSSSREFNKPTRLARLLAGGEKMYRLTHFPAEGGFYERERTHMKESFHKRSLNSYADIMVAIDEGLVEEFRKSEKRYIHKDMMLLTLEAVSRTLFTINSKEHHQLLLQSFEVIVKDIGMRIGNPFRIPPIIPTPHSFRLRSAVRVITEVLENCFEEHRVDGREEKDFIDIINEQKGDNKFLEDLDWQYTLAGVLAAGYETTAAGLAWTWYLLAKHPEVVSKIRAEVNEVVGNRPIRGNDFINLKYTERVFREAMRLYPPIPIIPRNVGKQYVLDDVVVPKGAVVVVSPWVTHRDERFFPDPEVFDPERWNDAKKASIIPLSYIPFSAGPRHCIGYGFASVEATLAIAVLWREFNFELISGEEPTPQMSIGLRPSNGLPMLVSKI